MPFTRADVVRAALEQLDDGGIDSVTVRAVAQRLGVKAPALYWHVRNKQELLDEMGTEVQRRIVAASLAAAEADDDLLALLGSHARATRTEYLAHRDGARTFSGTRLTDPGVIRDQEPGLRALVERGHRLESVITGFQIVNAFVVGFVIEEQERAQSAPERYDLGARDQAVGEEHPLALAAGRVGFGDADAQFAEQLEVVLAGVGSVLLSAPRPASTARRHRDAGSRGGPG
ncbi:TetR family transcriptional regulator [Nocardioides mangrovicus]|uniref:TetR family transcriptional regulator n=1 Tax=Nocardioides mangrovicus TaxID=2478913 RepID=A0A3L8P708_9ACTN|nr:TetR/AcrR family transcriptional regulator C-terminal domain-containing protein [Nocardioides mangrovicus]RLV51041.1 TetR family transcriptional regulator [Nocardioides mangrovicus]